MRPRTATPRCGEFDGIATFLACHSVQMFLDMHDSVSEIPQDGPHPSLRTPSLDTASDSSKSSSAVPCLDVLLDAHVLPGHGKHLSAILPFLCVADIDNIVDLMSSLACQRHVWGIPEPVVGFALSKSGTIAELMLSWLDPTTVSLLWRCIGSIFSPIF